MMHELIGQLAALRDDMINMEQHHVTTRGRPHPNYTQSQRNLLHYLALRGHDLRPLQHKLAVLGLSSLGRTESHVLPSIDAVLAALRSLQGETLDPTQQESQYASFDTGNRLLELHSRELLGPSPAQRAVRIMVTLPSEAETDFTLIHSLLQQGMDIVRINCAHDGPAVWERMIRHIHRAEKMLGRPCRILMDLGGPKLRTGPIEGGPPVLKVRPRRNAFGAVIAPGRIWITSAKKPACAPTPADALLPVPAAWISTLNAGDRIHFTDARGARRNIAIVDKAEEGCWAEIDRTAYIIPGTSLTSRDSSASVGTFQAPPGYIDLASDDLLILTRQLQPGHQATRDSMGRVLSPARMSCTLPEIFDDVQTGERVWFDDGKIGGTIEKVEPDRLFIRITQVRAEGEKLRSDKGINLPDSALKLPALTKKDMADVAFVAEHANMVGLSFAQSAADVEMLLARLNQLGR